MINSENNDFVKKTHNAEINKLIVDAGRILQRLENNLKKEYSDSDEYLHTKTEISFPCGVIRTVSRFEELYPCEDEGLGKNIAYTLLGVDVLRWLLNRFNILGIAQEMIIKTAIVMVVSVIEGLVYEKVKKLGDTPAKKFSKNIKKLKKQKVISSELYQRLEEIRYNRNNVHLYLPGTKEFQKYELKDYNEAITALKLLRSELYNE